MEVLCKDSEKKRALSTGASFACNLLNGVVVPICKELNFDIDVCDSDTLDEYLRDINALHSNYIEKMSEEASNPALIAVLKNSAETLWSAAYRKHPISNPYIISDIPKGIMEVVTITGSDIYSFHARTNHPAIEKACNIYADEEDISKREELEGVCDALNGCFNGRAHLFSSYITVAQGRFVPVERVSNYKVLINGNE